MPEDWVLLPIPRELDRREGTCHIELERFILLDAPQPQRLMVAAERVRGAVAGAAASGTGARWRVVAGRSTPPALVWLTLRLCDGPSAHPQGYELSIQPRGVLVQAHDEAGLFYGACTLAQLLEQAGTDLPCLEIVDWPDYAARGVMIDISRDKVPTLETVLQLVDMFAGWKINQLQLYTEHTFAYQNHPQVWAQASPFTGEEIMALDAYCRARYVELVPNQNSLGHMERWLRISTYSPLAEIVGEFTAPWGRHKGPNSLCPTNPASLRLMEGLYDELLPHFSSRMFNVGCDETFDIGQGASRAACEQLGPGRLYLDYLLQVYEAVRARGRTMQFWGDIIIQHPNLIPELPRDTIALDWGYEADYPFDEHGARFASTGIPFYVCPGTSSWCTVAGRTQNMLGNQAGAAANGLKHGAVGYLNTDWGDRGHWQALPVSFLGWAVGAAYSWAWQANHGLDAALVAGRHAFRDPSGAMGRVAYDLGDIYRVPGPLIHNSSYLFLILQKPLEQLRGDARLDRDCLHETLSAIDSAMTPMSQAKMARPDAALIQREFANTARLLRHACRRGLMALEQEGPAAAQSRGELRQDLCAIVEEYRALWLARNRPGGLPDSLRRFEQTIADYRN